MKDVTDVVHSLQFRLSDEQGNTVTADAYHGDIVMLYFGYTHCPDVCPLTLSKLGRAVDALDDDSARRVKILFVSVDPKRDSATQLATYTNAFGPEFVGLRGSPSRIRTITKRYRVTYSYGKPDAEGDYAVNHSSSVFIFDGSGEARLLAMSSDGVSAITHDLALLARSHS